MHIDPVKTARTIYDEALGSLMAHTIRGVTNHFRRSQIELAVSVSPDTYNQIGLEIGGQGPTSILVSRFLRDKVYARIFIHQDANHHLARVCIAHEIYHLLLQLHHFLDNEKKQWAHFPVSKAIEDECNQFAWELCRLHDAFNRDDALRKKHIFFPDHIFDKPFKMHSTEWYREWVEGINLDPQHPFWKR